MSIVTYHDGDGCKYFVVRNLGTDPKVLECFESRGDALAFIARGGFAA